MIKIMFILFDYTQAKYSRQKMSASPTSGVSMANIQFLLDGQIAVGLSSVHVYDPMQVRQGSRNIIICCIPLPTFS